MQALACMERGVWAAVRLLSKLSQLLVRDMAKKSSSARPSVVGPRKMQVY